MDQAASFLVKIIKIKCKSTPSVLKLPTAPALCRGEHLERLRAHPKPSGGGNTRHVFAAGFSCSLFLPIKNGIPRGFSNSCLGIGCLAPRRDALEFCTWLYFSLLPHRRSQRLRSRGEGARQQQVLLKLRGSSFPSVVWVGSLWM